jgi:3-deoxy-D-manno-octulosonic-acid transferase
MVFLYAIGIKLFGAAVWLFSFFNAKASLFVAGRKNLLPQLKTAMQGNVQPVVWIHCASLGEFEQGRPVIEALKKELPHHKIVLTFFSPSGYEVRKAYAPADWVFYLPLDTKTNAHQFVEYVQPVLAIFVKYEFWYQYATALHKRAIPIISIASIFRQEQVFFKWYGSLFRHILKRFSHFFVQNYRSQDLLKSIGISHATVSGDTRFDRVVDIANKAEGISLVENFKRNDKVMVVGSAWPEDVEVLAPFINEQGAHLKFIIAPHEVSEASLTAIEKQLQQKTIRFSRFSADETDASVLLIDNVGMLSRLYRYGEFAYIGGAFGKGLHNVLEAACYGIPVFFGNRNFEKFQEALDLINRGGAFAVSDYHELRATYETVSVPENFLLACEVTKSYVHENLGATEKIMNYCRGVLSR